MLVLTFGVAMGTNKILLTAVLSLSSLILIEGAARAADSQQPRLLSPASSDPTIQPVDLKNLPEFARNDQSAGTALRAGAQSATLPVQTHMKLIVEHPISATASRPGDLFEGHVKDDLFFGRTLILPRGSLVRGRVSEIFKPRLLSRAGKIGLKLDQIVTPTGEVIPLDASLEFRKGTTNKAGMLDPGTSFGTRVESSIKTVSGANQTGAARGALVAANVATLGAPIVATAIGSSAIAIFRSGDDISLSPGQELEILLTNELGVQVN